MAIPEHQMLAAAAAEGSFNPEEHAIERAESEPDAVVGLEVVEIQIVRVGGDLPRIVENGAVERREDLPSILGLQKQQVLVPEAVPVEPAQIVGPAQGPLEVEGHGRPGRVVGGGDERVQRDHTAIVEERDVLLEVAFQAVEVEPASFAVVELLEAERVFPSAPGIAAGLPVVDLATEVEAQEIGLLANAGHGILGEEV